jgi:hypothetical protein
VWAATHRLRLASPVLAHSLDLFWDASDWNFLGWYVDLQEPIKRSPLGFDTTDHALDVWVEPSGEWRWKDEDRLADLVRTGVFSRAEAATIRAEGERFLSERGLLLPTGWEDWRPDPAWPQPELPPEWESLEPAE